MFGLQPAHLIIILVVALLFFVPSRLPEFARALRQTIGEFRNSFKENAHDPTSQPPRQIDSDK